MAAGPSAAHKATEQQLKQAEQKLQQAMGDVEALTKERDAMGAGFAEKQRELAAAAAAAAATAASAADKEKKELNLKISELNSALKAAAAKEAKMAASSKMSSAGEEEERNKIVAQQRVKIMQLEGTSAAANDCRADPAAADTLREMDSNFKEVEKSVMTLRQSIKVVARVTRCVEQLASTAFVCILIPQQCSCVQCADSGSPKTAARGGVRSQCGSSRRPGGADHWVEAAAAGSVQHGDGDGDGDADGDADGDGDGYGVAYDSCFTRAMQAATEESAKLRHASEVELQQKERRLHDVQDECEAVNKKVRWWLWWLWCWCRDCGGCGG